MDKSEPPAPKPARGRKPVLDPELVAAAIAQLAGNLTAVAKRFDVHRSSVQELVAKRPALQQVLADARAAMVDNVESRFYADCLKDGPQYQTSRIFFLKTQARDRGYVEPAARPPADVEAVDVYLLRLATRLAALPPGGG